VEFAKVRQYASDDRPAHVPTHLAQFPVSIQKLQSSEDPSILIELTGAGPQRCETADGARARAAQDTEGPEARQD
jgi:hypothetical protein